MKKVTLILGIVLILMQYGYAIEYRPKIICKNNALLGYYDVAKKISSQCNQFGVNMKLINIINFLKRNDTQENINRITKLCINECGNNKICIEKGVKAFVKSYTQILNIKKVFNNKDNCLRIKKIFQAY